MKTPTYDQVAAALYAYDMTIGDARPDFAKRIEAMRAALTVALSSTISTLSPLDIAVALHPPKEI